MTNTPQIDLRVSPQVAHNTKAIIQELAKKLNCPEQEITAIKVIKRSIDARKPNIKFQLRILYSTKTQPITFPTPKLKHYNTIQPTSAKVHIIGSGPAGLFAALRCLELGLKPIKAYFLITFLVIIPVCDFIFKWYTPCGKSEMSNL